MIDHVPHMILVCDDGKAVAINDPFRNDGKGVTVTCSIIRVDGRDGE